MSNNGLDAVAIERIVNLATEANGVKILDLPGGGREVVLVSGGKKLGEIVTERPDWMDRIRDVTSLARLIKNRKNSAEVWCDTRHVYAAFDSDRHDVAEMPLEYHHAFLILCELAKIPFQRMQHKPFVRMLRLEMMQDVSVFAPFVSLKWSTQADQNQTVGGNGKDKMGISIDTAASGAEGGLPSELVISVPVYKLPAPQFEAHILCRVEIDTAEQRIMLVPDIQQIEAAKEAALKNVCDEINSALGEDAKSVPVYCGSCDISEKFRNFNDMVAASPESL